VTAAGGSGEPAARTRRRWAVIAVVAGSVTAGVGAYWLTPTRDIAPVQGLRQLDMLYLDEPAPGLAQLGVERGRPAVVLFCAEPCEQPPVTGAQVVESDDADLATRYGLRTREGRIGPGYALVDPDGRLRYSTFDPAPGEHAAEIQVLLDALADRP
jgi:hypothetical protein